MTKKKKGGKCVEPLARYSIYFWPPPYSEPPFSFAGWLPLISARIQNVMHTFGGRAQLYCRLPPWYSGASLRHYIRGGVGGVRPLPTKKKVTGSPRSSRKGGRNMSSHCRTSYAPALPTTVHREGSPLYIYTCIIYMFA